MTREINRRRSSGLSLVELMIGTVIALILVLVVLETFVSSEAQRRTTAGINEAQVNGLFALSVIERDLRMAGNGVVSSSAALNCPLTRAYNDAASPTIYELRWAPVLITDGGAGSDQITMLYSNSP